MKLAVIPGDGIGPEVVAEGLKVLRGVVPGVATTEYDLGAARWHRTGELLPDSVLRELRDHDAILLGAVGDPTVPSGILERGLLLRLRFELDHHVNLRPARLYPGVPGPLAGDKAIGRMDRKFKLRDQYVLDLTADAERTLDRRLAIALAIGLDTLQNR